MAEPLISVPLCEVKGCPAPSDDDWHRCWARPIKGHECFGGVTHQHYPKKGMGAGRKSRIVACLCAGFHDTVDNGTKYANCTYRDDSRRLIYLLWANNKDGTPGRTLIHRFVDTAEVVGGDVDGKLAAVLEYAGWKETNAETVVDRVIGEAGRSGEGQAKTQPSAPAGISSPRNRRSPARLSGHPESQQARQDGQQGQPSAISMGEPNSPPEIDAIGTYQIGHRTEKAALPAKPMVEDFHLTPISEERVDFAALSDEELATLYAWADQQQRNCFLTKCQVVHAYRMRYEPIAGEDWLEAAYELFHVSRRTLYAYSNVWEVCVTSDTHVVDAIGPLTDSRSLIQFIGRKPVEEGRVALAAAVAHIAEFGEPPTVAALAHRLDEEELGQERPPCEHDWAERCRICGQWREPR